MDEFMQELKKIRLVITDVDGVHTDDKLSIFKLTDEERKSFTLEESGATYRMLMCDVDGTPTPHLYYLSAGPDRIEGYRFYAGDGIAVKQCLASAIPVVFITGRISPAVLERARNLGVECYRGAADKIAVAEPLLAERGLTWDEVLFIGNDITDLPLIHKAGLAAAPANAVPEVKSAVDCVASAAGGNGAVREILETLLKAQGKWTVDAA